VDGGEEERVGGGGESLLAGGGVEERGSGVEVLGVGEGCGKSEEECEGEAHGGSLVEAVVVALEGFGRGYFFRRASSSSRVRGQSEPRRRERLRSARTLPAVWQVGQ